MKKYIIALLIAVFIVPSFSFAQVSDIDPNQTASDCVNIVNNLRYRDRDINKNGEVSTLQDYLQSQNYLKNDPTGYFGLLTLKAVKSFQKENNISPTGYVGPVTREKIRALSCDGTTPLPKPKEGKITGFLTTQGPSINMWGTHALSVTEVNPCLVAPCPETSRTYLVKAENDSVLADLNRYQNTRVTITGEARWMNINAGFWGIIAEKVTTLPFTSSNPVISGVSGPQSLYVNETGTWTVNAYDPNGGNLSYSVNWGDVNYINGTNVSSAIGQATQSATFTHSYSQAGTYTPKFTVTNSSGQSASTSLSVRISMYNMFPIGCNSLQGYSAINGLPCSSCDSSKESSKINGLPCN